MNRRLLSMLLIALLALGIAAPSVAEEAPMKISMLFPDNATMPFTEDWLVIKETEKRLNVELEYVVVPFSDYSEKVQLMMTSGDAPDVIMYADTSSPMYRQFALNGSFVSIDDYDTPNFDARVAEWNLTEAVDAIRLADGKLYQMPSLYSQSFYDGGLILRDDLLEKYGLEAPKTYDDLYNVMKVFKENDPESYPLTTLIRPSVLYRMTMPSYGISLAANSSTGSHVLSWDYENKEYFAGAIHDGFKQYVGDLAKWYAEGLIDPEYIDNPSDLWSSKMSTGFSSVTYAYYDQIGGLLANSEIEGISFNMYPPLVGPGGAHHQPKSRTGYAVMFPSTAAKRDDFAELVLKVDDMFFSEEGAILSCLGVEGETFNYAEDGSIEFTDVITASPDGVYKTLQINYGAGHDTLQKVWLLEREMTKYDENYAKINAEVATMDDAIQAIPPAPKFDDFQTEEANFMKATLQDEFDVWINAFITGEKSVEADWDEYVGRMVELGIEEYLTMYNDAR